MDTKLSAHVPIRFGTLRLLAFVVCNVICTMTARRLLPAMQYKMLTEILIAAGAYGVCSLIFLRGRPTVFLKDWWNRNIIGYTVWYWEEKTEEKYWVDKKDLCWRIVRRNTRYPCPSANPCFFIPLGGWFQSDTRTRNLSTNVMHPLEYGITSIKYTFVSDSPASLLFDLKHGETGETYRLNTKNLLEMLMWHSQVNFCKDLDGPWTKKFFKKYQDRVQWHELLKTEHETFCKEILDAYELLCTSSRLQHTLEHTDEGKKFRKALSSTLMRLRPDDPLHLRFMQIECANAGRELKRRNAKTKPPAEETPPDEVA